MRIELTGRQAQCVLCGLVFTSDNGAENHKNYRGPNGSAQCVHPSTLGMVERDRGWCVPLPESAMTWAANAVPVEPAGPQILTCTTCGIVWERPAQRGRKPHSCPDCKAKAIAALEV